MLSLFLTIAVQWFSIPEKAPNTYTVYFFLLEDCKITQAYTDCYTQLYEQYHCDSIRFVALFPNAISTDSTVAAFQHKYQLPFECTRQQAIGCANKFAIMVTPEVVVYHAAQDSVLYQGRTDNLFERIGRRREVVTSHELAAALYSIQHGKAVPIPRTTAVGCFLER